VIADPVVHGAGFFSAADSQPPAWHDAQGGLPQFPLHWANDGRNLAVDTVNHDSAAVTNVAMLDPHDGFIIR
jgi:hypothetical protein